MFQSRSLLNVITLYLAVQYGVQTRGNSGVYFDRLLRPLVAREGRGKLVTFSLDLNSH